MAVMTFGLQPAGLKFGDYGRLDIYHGQMIRGDLDLIRYRSAEPVISISGVMDAVLAGEFRYEPQGLAGGRVDSLQIDLNGTMLFRLTALDTPVLTLLGWSANVQVLLENLLAGSDSITGSTLGEYVPGLGGDDTIAAGSGDDTVEGGLGANYLRGDDGADRILGGDGFDDINGNQGADTAFGGAGGDWVVGGKDNDSLAGDAGADIVYGNLGNDTCDGGADADVARGGQDDDVVFGGLGDDWLSGDRGADTLTGGGGADVFHTFGEAGVDRVLDFNRAEGDRVQVDPGTNYTATQSGADVVISMTGGGRMTLVGVQMASLSGGWIFGA